MREIAEPVGLEIEFNTIPDIPDIAYKLQRCLILEAERCAAEGEALLTAQPDLVFGDGSIFAMLRLAEEAPGTCVAVPHPRVLDQEFVLDMGADPLDNAQLVRLAMKHLHSSWAHSNLGGSKVNCWQSGSAWRALGDGLIGVSMRIPTIFLARPLPADVEFLKRGPSTGAWDHAWPEKLVAEQRQRVIGSSDAAFVVELTRRGANGCEVRERPSENPDAYQGTLGHHKINRNVVAVWRCG